MRNARGLIRKRLLRTRTHVNVSFQFFDSPDEVNRKSKQLAEMIRSSRHCIVNTGAGVSTAAGIPDFR